MPTVSISSPNLAALQARLQAMAQALPAALAPASSNIATSIRAEIDMRYGVVAKYLSVTEGQSGGAASVRIFGDHPHLLWWEYGTRAHGISPVNAQALRFSAGGGTVFARHVNHPGTPAHNQRGRLQAALGYTAAYEWHGAIDTLLRSL